MIRTGDTEAEHLTHFAKNAPPITGPAIAVDRITMPENPIPGFHEPNDYLKGIGIEHPNGSTSANYPPEADTWADLGDGRQFRIQHTGGLTEGRHPDAYWDELDLHVRTQDGSRIHHFHRSSLGPDGTLLRTEERPTGGQPSGTFPENFEAFHKRQGTPIEEVRAMPDHPSSVAASDLAAAVAAIKADPASGYNAFLEARPGQK